MFEPSSMIAYWKSEWPELETWNPIEYPCECCELELVLSPASAGTESATTISPAAAVAIPAVNGDRADARAMRVAMAGPPGASRGHPERLMRARRGTAIG